MNGIEKIYKVTKIDGEYAYLSDGTDELFIALALLPAGTDEGSSVRYIFPDFELLD